MRIGKLKDNKEFLVNPSYEIRKSENYELDLIACGRDGTINMIEIGANEVTEEILMKALEVAKEELNKIQKFQETIIKEMGREKLKIKKIEIPEDLEKAFEKQVLAKIENINPVRIIMINLCINYEKANIH